MTLDAAIDRGAPAGRRGSQKPGTLTLGSPAAGCAGTGPAPSSRAASTRQTNRVMARLADAEVLSEWIRGTAISIGLLVLEAQRLSSTAGLCLAYGGSVAFGLILRSPSSAASNAAAIACLLLPGLTASPIATAIWPGLTSLVKRSAVAVRAR